jgi:hypothetical protein
VLVLVLVLLVLVLVLPAFSPKVPSIVELFINMIMNFINRSRDSRGRQHPISLLLREAPLRMPRRNKRAGAAAASL